MAKVNNCPLCKSFNIKKRVVTAESLGGMGMGAFIGGPLAIAAGAITGAVMSDKYHCNNCNTDFTYDKKSDDYGITKVFGISIKEMSNGRCSTVWSSTHEFIFDLENQDFEAIPIDDDELD